MKFDQDWPTCINIEIYFFEIVDDGLRSIGILLAHLSLRTRRTNKLKFQCVRMCFLALYEIHVNQQPAKPLLTYLCEIHIQRNTL